MPLDYSAVKLLFVPGATKVAMGMPIEELAPQQ